MKPAKLLLLAGDFVEDYEIMVPFQALQMVGHTVDAVCPGKKKGEQMSHRNSRLRGRPDIHRETRPQLHPQRYLRRNRSGRTTTALSFPAAARRSICASTPRCSTSVRHFDKADKPIAALCHGPQLLAAAGVIKGNA